MTEPEVSWRDLPFSTRWVVSGLWPQDDNPTTTNDATAGGEAGAMQWKRAKTLKSSRHLCSNSVSIV